jgi:hypothetical protein
MKKKSVIILCSVIAICAIGLVSSHFIDWPVDVNDASGDIAKATRFSRGEASEKLTNMEELLQTDSAFKDGIVAAQVVMQTRATQFASLVDMSNEVAGGIPAYADVLNDMNKAVEIVTNANNSLAEAGGDLNAALGGEERPDLEQNTINAAMAYTTLQKQNKLADRFIEVTDKYLETAQGDDRLKFVRDQWLEYQQMTAALEGNKENAEALAKKGNLLTGEKTLGALASFGPICQASIIYSCQVAKSFNIDTQIASTLPAEFLGQLVSSVRSASGATMQQVNTDGALNQRQVEQIYNKEVGEAIKSAFENVSGARANAIGQHYTDGLSLAHKGLAQTQNGLAQTQKGLALVNKDALGLANNGLIIMQTAQMIGLINVMSAFDKVASTAPALQQSQNIELGQRIGDMINQTAMGNRPTVSLIPDL